METSSLEEATITDSDTKHDFNSAGRPHKSKPTMHSKPRSLLFLGVTTIRLLTIVAMLLLIVSSLVSMAQNIKSYQQRNISNGSVEETSPTSAPIPTQTTVASSLSRSSARSRTLTSASVQITFASELQQPDRQQLASISRAAAAQASSLNNVKRSNIPVTKNLKLAVDSSSQQSLDSCGYVRGTDIPNRPGGLVFFILNKFLTIFVLTFMMFSEMAPPRFSAFYTKYFPVLGETSGVGWLGALMLWIATAALSQSNDTFQDVAAWFNFVLGILNIILGVTLLSDIRRMRSLISSDQTPSWQNLPEPQAREISKPFNISRPVLRNNESRSMLNQSVSGAILPSYTNNGSKS